MWDWMGHGGFGWGVGMLVMALFWLLFAALLVWVIRAPRTSRSSPKG